MAYVKKTVQEYITETDDKTVEGFNNNQEDRIASELSIVNTKLSDGFNSEGALPKGDAGSQSYWLALKSGIYQTIGGDGISGLPGKYGVAVVHRSGAYVTVTFTSTTGTGTGYGAWVFSGFNWLKIT